MNVSKHRRTPPDKSKATLPFPWRVEVDLASISSFGIICDFLRPQPVLYKAAKIFLIISAMARIGNMVHIDSDERALFPSLRW